MNAKSLIGLVRRSFDLLGLRMAAKRERRNRGPRTMLRFEPLEHRQLMSVSPVPTLPDAARLLDGSVRFIKDSISQAYYAPSVSHQDFNFVDDFGNTNPKFTVEVAESLACVMRYNKSSPKLMLLLDPRAVDRIDLSSEPISDSPSDRSGRSSERCNHNDFSIVNRLNIPSPKLTPPVACCHGPHIREITVQLSGSPNRASEAVEVAERGRVAVIDPRAVDRINLSSMALQSSSGAPASQWACRKAGGQQEEYMKVSMGELD